MRLSDKMPRREVCRAPKAAASRRTSLEPNPKHNEETEVKLRVADRQGLLRQLARLQASYHGRVHEMNTLYDTPDGALRREGKLLRIRVERPAERPQNRTPNSAKAPGAGRDNHAALLTFKGPVRRGESGKSRGGHRYKIREEREVRVPDGEVLVRILEALGLRPCFRYEKYRSTYRLPRLSGVELDLDETPIGDFLEAEGSRGAVDRAAALLGYRPADYINKSYGELFLDEARGTALTSPSKRRGIPGEGSRDMLFRSKK
jgi:adenylate cyclase class 2